MNPPIKPITWTVVNGTPPNWGSTIRAFSCEYTYSDGDTEKISAPYPISITSGNSMSKTAIKIKCVIKCHVAVRIDDDKGIHLFEKIYLPADFKNPCPDTHETIIAPKQQEVALKFPEIMGEVKIKEYDIHTSRRPTKVGNG